MAKFGLIQQLHKFKYICPPLLNNALPLLRIQTKFCVHLLPDAVQQLLNLLWGCRVLLILAFSVDHSADDPNPSLLSDGCRRVGRAQDEWYDTSGHSATLGAEVRHRSSLVVQDWKNVTSYKYCIFRGGQPCLR